MKKRLLSIAFVAAIAVTASWTFAQSENKATLSELTLANVEALANDENNAIDQEGYKYVASPRPCCKAYQPREFKCSSTWPDC